VEFGHVWWAIVRFGTAGMTRCFGILIIINYELRQGMVGFGFVMHGDVRFAKAL
jgi:hypothetical protein